MSYNSHDGIREFGYAPQNESRSYGSDYGVHHFSETTQVYSPLEQIMIEEPHTLTLQSNKQYNHGYLTSTENHHYFVPNDFLTSTRSPIFAGSAQDVQHYIAEAFEKTTGMQLPTNIAITITDEKGMRKAHHNWNPSIVGFSLNGHGKRPSQVFVLQGHLDSVMLTLGHEIGHVISSTLPDPRDEEAKAFAFSTAWMHTIINNNIAGLSNCINPAPAHNGLHDVAFDFVQQKLKTGTNALNLFNDLRTTSTSITNQLENIIIH